MTLGLKGGRWDLGRSRSSWKTSDFEPFKAVRSRWVSVGLGCPIVAPTVGVIRAELAVSLT